MKLIGIAGKAGSGKDTVARMLEIILTENDESSLIVHFGDPVKRAAAEVFGVGTVNFYDPKLKEEVVPYWGLTPRRMLQLLGTEAVRGTFGDDHWVKRLMLTVEALKNHRTYVIVPDVRFESEAAAIREAGGHVWHMVRKFDTALSPLAQSHSSEQGVEFKDGDLQILNNGTLEDLREYVDSICFGGLLG